MPLALGAQSTFLDIKCSNNRHLPHSALVLQHAETTNWASQLQEHLQAALVNGVQKITISLSSKSVRYQTRVHDNVPNNSSPHADNEVDLGPMSVDSTRLILCPKETAVNTHT